MSSLTVMKILLRPTLPPRTQSAPPSVIEQQKVTAAAVNVAANSVTVAEEPAVVYLQFKG